jgi:hypothetical protein
LLWRLDQGSIEVGMVTTWSWDKEGCKAGEEGNGGEEKVPKRGEAMATGVLGCKAGEEGNGGGEKVPKWGEAMTTGVPKWGEATANGAVPDLCFGVSGFLIMWEFEASSTRSSWLVAVGTE